MMKIGGIWYRPVRPLTVSYDGERTTIDTDPPTPYGLKPHNRCEHCGRVDWIADPDVGGPAYSWEEAEARGWIVLDDERFDREHVL